MKLNTIGFDINRLRELDNKLEKEVMSKHINKYECLCERNKIKQQMIMRLISLEKEVSGLIFELKEEVRVNRHI